MRRVWSIAAGRAACICGLAAVVIACSAPARTSRMTGDDLEMISTEMAASLAGSDAVRGRTAQSPRWVVAFIKVRNLTSDVMTESEQWSIMARVRSGVSLQALGEQRNIRFVIPAEQSRRIMQSDMETFGVDFGADRKPTHEINATFRSITRADQTNRSELYYCEFQLLDLGTGEPVWSDKVEYKRVAKGHIWD